MRTISANMEAERVKDGPNGAWLVVATIDHPDESTSTVRLADFETTISGNLHEGLIAENGLEIGFQRVKPIGGLPPVSEFNLAIRDEEGESAIAETHVLYNDEVIVYFLFPTGSEVDADRIEIARGAIKRHPSRANLWRWSMRDISQKDLKDIPNDTIDPNRYPYAYSADAVIPEAFGNLNTSPMSSKHPALAECRCVNRYLGEFVSSKYKKSGSTAFEWYDQAKRFAEVITSSETANILTVNDGSRRMLMRPSRPKGTNDVTDWYLVADGDESDGADIVNTDNLDFYLSGCPKLGAMTDIRLIIKATGSFTYTLKDDTTTITSAGVSNDQNYQLTLADFQDNWDMALLNVEIDGTANATIEEVYLQVDFEDFFNWFDQEPRIFQLVTGFEDQAANYNDGAVITGAGTVLTNPAHIAEAMLRGRKMHNLPTAEVGDFSAAAALRTTWAMAWSQVKQDKDRMLDKFGFESGLMFFNKLGAHQCVALDKSRDPQHFFYGGYDMPVLGEVADPRTWQYDFEMLPADANKIYNEIIVRYAKHPATGVPTKSKAASGLHRLTGTCNTDGTAATLTDASATFVTDLVLVDERIYVSGDVDYKVVSVDSETVLTIAPVSAAGVSDNTSKTYWLGPNVRSECVLSQVGYKMVNALGGSRQKDATSDGGFIADFIHDDTTANNLLEHAVEWFANPRERVRFSLTHDGILLEQGDVFFMDHAKLKTQHRGLLLTTLLNNCTDSATVIDIVAGEAGLYRAGDYFYMQDTVTSVPEVMLVDSVDTINDQLTVQRGQLNTKASAHVATVGLLRLTWKWLCTGIRPPLPNDPRILVEAERMPNSYFPVGIAVATGQDYDVATPAQRAQQGYATLQSGRVVDGDPDSNISYART